MSISSIGSYHSEVYSDYNRRDNNNIYHKLEKNIAQNDSTLSIAEAGRERNNQQIKDLGN